jgi:hypothetical protein
MSANPSKDPNQVVACPHCRKTFTSQLLSGPADRHQGFKCPHCRLFIAYGREDAAEPPEDN